VGETDLDLNLDRPGERTIGAVANQQPLTVLTYNVGSGLALPGRLVPFLRESGADVIGLQEIDPAQAEAITRGTSDLYPYQIVRGTGFSGRGLLSKHPIACEDWHDLSVGRPDLHVVLDVAGHPVSFVVAHPPPPRIGRRGVVFQPETLKQIDRLAEIIREAAPGVLVGDFNMTIRNPSYTRLVNAGLIDAYKTAAGRGGATFPLRPGKMQRVKHGMHWVPLPAFTRVDYIWHTPELKAVQAWVAHGAGSDHRPVFARLLLPAPVQAEPETERVILRS
jgi:endonuclease/exonuclease/phosphatase family metal-dependent hydrolase